MPEAIDYINKYFLMREFGWAETWRSLDNMSFYDYELIITCHNAAVKKEKMDADRAQFYSKEGVMAT